MSEGAGGEWFEDESFWTAWAPLMFDEARWAEVPAVVDQIERLAGTRPGQAVLDACCGPGRHALEFASRGYRVTGLDLCAAYLEAARDSAAAWGVELELVRGDLRRYSRPGGFDLALNLYASFGYFADQDGDLAALRALRDSLRPGGNLVLETLGKETAARDFTGGEWFERGGWTILTEYSVAGDWEALRNRWVMLRGDERREKTFDIRLYSGSELRAALAASGFSSVRIMGGLDGSPYDQDASGLVALASR